jgi:predicted short-subunit dehydrogenase-like oxidoreductase (DUF2520 family)
MTSVVFLGFGNLGSHLCNALHKSSYISIIQIYNRRKIKISSELKHIPFTKNISEIKEADVYIIAIPDDAIRTFSESLPMNNKFVVHTSGSAAINELSDANRKGVFYPLQTFSKNKIVSFREIPICIEAENAADLKLLRDLAELLSEKVIEINSEARAKLHLAAVFVNNFVNYLYAIGEEITERNNLSFKLLLPLITETARKIENLSPTAAQTGPAIRRDKKTIEKHLHLLIDSPYKEIYELLTDAIQKKSNN